MGAGGCDRADAEVRERQFFERLLPRLHDAGQRDITRFVETQVGGDDGGERDHHGLDAGVGLASAARPSAVVEQFEFGDERGLAARAGPGCPGGRHPRQHPAAGHCQLMLDGLQKRTFFYTVVILMIMVMFLVMWWLLRSQRPFHTPLFVISVLLALTVLFVGLTTPMIEIDARIKEMTFILLGENISFHDQVIFFQSKSIVDVVRILIDTGNYDSVFVGVLILIFSIVFPIGKLTATEIYLLGNKKWRANKVVQFFAFKSGKWSMADVNVVAIFMAYIGFKGILDSQLESLNMKTDSLASISTNETTLQPGFILFVAFVLFGLILSVILGRITASEDSRRVEENSANAGLAGNLALAKK